MLKDIIYDHAYTLDKGHKFLRELEKLGFTLNEQTVEHPGKAFCRFIMFSDPKRNLRQYLEFVDVRGKNQERKRKSPGLSFRFLKSLESYYKKLKKKPSLRPKFNHKNYQWKENSKDRLPGWNFVDFNSIPTKSLYPWFTEYEPSPHRKKSPKKSAHPNGAYEIGTIEISVTPKVKGFFSDILSTKIKDHLVLGNGVKIFFKASSKNRFERILVRVKSLKRFEKFIGKTSLTVTKTSRGYLIHNPHKNPLMYDVEIVE